MKFGSYTFPAGFYVIEDPLEQRIGTAEIPRRGGVIVSSPVLRERRIRIGGRLTTDFAVTPVGVRALADAMLAQLGEGRRKLYVDPKLDRYIYAQFQNFNRTYQPGLFDYLCDVELEFLADSPYWEAETAESYTWTSPGNGDDITLAVGGTAPCWPSFAFTAGATGALDIELAIGDITFTLAGDVSSGDIITVDCDAETVTLDYISAATPINADAMSYFDGSFPSFAVGSNLLVLTNTGVAVSQIAISWRSRWY